LPAQHFPNLALALGVEAVGERDLHLGGVRQQLGLIEADELVEIRHAADVSERGARLDNMLQLIAQEGLPFEDARQRGSDKVDIDLTRSAIQVLADDAAGVLPLAVACPANRKAGHEMESLPVEG